MSNNHNKKDPPVPGWPPSMPAHLTPSDEGYNAARDVERRQVLSNVRYLAAVVDGMRRQQKSTDDAIASLRRDNQRQFETIAQRLDENTVITTETKDYLTAIKKVPKFIKWLRNFLLGLGGISAALIAIWSAIQLINK